MEKKVYNKGTALRLPMTSVLERKPPVSPSGTCPKLMCFCVNANIDWHNLPVAQTTREISNTARHHTTIAYRWARVNEARVALRRPRTARRCAVWLATCATRRRLLSTTRPVSTPPLSVWFDARLVVTCRLVLAHLRQWPHATLRYFFRLCEKQ